MTQTATYDVDFIHSTINSTPVLHVSFVPDHSTLLPVILPMIGQMGKYDANGTDPDAVWTCYLHGYVSSRLMKTADDSVQSGDLGIPICVAATKVDGFVLTLTPNSHNYNYRSAVLHGHATVVDTDEEKLWAMRLITNSVVPDRWENSRIPPDGAEMQSTRILKVHITAASGKVREGVPNDEKKDLKREDVLNKVWTGVIPVYETYGEPQPGPYNRVKELPEHVEGFVLSQNEINERYAFDAAFKDAPVKRKKAGEVEDD
jgi:nitroimidazol reductase NimA-like FMN-containing flavoprotein (pyridoxamine 5'-phosphate oxidase superfamily)